MIPTITSLLRQEGLVRSSGRLRFNILFTKGTCLVAEVFATPNEAFFLKFSEITNLRAEFNLIDKAQTIFPEFVPRHYGYYNLPKLDVIVAERVRFLPVKTFTIFEHGQTRLKSQITHFITHKQRRVPISPNESVHNTLITNVHLHLKALGLADCLEPWLESRELEMLQVISQHGDFVHNNLGTARNRLFVFDWEDFGKVCLPGFDLATLLLADIGFDATKIATLMKNGLEIKSKYSDFLRQCCAGTAIEYSLFLRLMPVYIAVFLYLKREYGPEIQSQVSTCLQQLIGIMDTPKHLS